MSDITQNPEGNPLVSIIVPIYNVEPYLSQCVNSLLCQTLKNIEIILVDDGSLDNCPAICDAYVVEDKRIKVIHQPNSGYGKACNIGIGVAKADFFGIIEADDYIEPLMFEILYNKAKLSALDITRCHYYRYNSNVNTHERVELLNVPQDTVCTPGDILSFFLQPPAVWSMLYRKSLILENNIRFLETPGASYQDTSFSFKALAYARRFMLIGDTFVHYRIDSENSSSVSKEKVFCVCEEFREIEKFVDERNLAKTLSPIIPKMKFSTYMWNYKRIAKKNRWVFLKRFAEEMRDYISKKLINKDYLTPYDFIKIYTVAYFYPLVYIGFAGQGDNSD